MTHTKCYIKGYPRPQFVRKPWLSLDGEWNFAFDDNDEGEQKGYQNGFTDKKINVPFSYESQASGISDERMVRHVWYSKTVKITKSSGAILNFEGCDYHTKVWVNGIYVGENFGAFHRFSFAIGKQLNIGENTIVVKASDDYSCERPRGKQRWEDRPFGCWYIQTTGIYKSVWLEFVSDSYLETLKITPDLNNISVGLDFTVAGFCKDLSLKIDITLADKKVATVEVDVTSGTNSIIIPLMSLSASFKYELWLPNQPILYDVTFTLKKCGEAIDEVGSYFGLRNISTSGDKVLLNDCPFVMKLILDQGYWKDSHLTPPSEDALLHDIQLIKDMGFNGVRKHQKIEDERFLYYADILGLLVWCEMPSAYWFSDMSIQEIASQWGKIITQNYNHPSVAVWVAFNESWGVPNIKTNKAQQNLATAMYYYTKAFDSMRPVISNDGWEHTISDILTIHNYEQDSEKLYGFYDTLSKAINGCTQNTQKLPYANGFEYAGQPIIFSEYGGTALVEDTKNGWGYGSAVTSGEELIVRYERLTKALMSQPYCAGYCYTQITDIQQEVNGLLSAEREPKVNIKKIKEINNKL